MKNILRSRVAIVGDSTVGKSAITSMFLSDGRNYPKAYEMTFGADLSVKAVQIPDTNDFVELYLYDSSGQSFYTDIISKYWNQPNMLMVVFDVTNADSLESVGKWTTLARDQVLRHGQQGAQGPNGVLVANKTDLASRRVVSPEEGRARAETLQLQYFECSAKEIDSVTKPFEWLAQEWHKMFLDTVSSFRLIN